MAIAQPYLMFLGEAPDQLAAKTAQGIVHWRPDWCLGQLRLPGCKADLKLPDMTLEQAKAAGARTVIVGVANRGGKSGGALDRYAAPGARARHGFGERAASAAVRHRAPARGGEPARPPALRRPAPDPGFEVGNGVKRPGKRLLAVGTDCSVGKMYTTLALEREMKRRGMKADFRATGQTGIFIAGDGVSIDAVVSDFVSGAVEWLSPANDPDHWDLIEGQGSLFHASFAGVSLGLLHGAQPDVLVLCHEPTRRHMRGLPTYPLPDLQRCIAANLEAARLTNPKVRCIAASINTAEMSEADAKAYIGETAKHLAMPVVDPVRTGWPPSSICWPENAPGPRLAGELADRGPVHDIAGSKTASDVILVEIEEGGFKGRGECVPYAHYGETMASAAAAIEGILPALESGWIADELQSRLPAGAARNAVDCALWDLAAKRVGQPVWALAGSEAARDDRHRLYPQPRHGGEHGRGGAQAGGPAAPEAEAGRARGPRPGRGGPRRCAKARLIVDANEGWTPEIYAKLAPRLKQIGVELVEQPLPAGKDEALAGMTRPVAVCADESCHDRTSLAAVAGRYDASTSSSTRPAG